MLLYLGGFEVACVSGGMLRGLLCGCNVGFEVGFPYFLLLSREESSL